MTPMIRTSLFLVAIAYALTFWCLADTTALSMTLFFSLSLPLFALAALLYMIEVLRDLRRHRVL